MLDGKETPSPLSVLSDFKAATNFATLGLLACSADACAWIVDEALLSGVSSCETTAVETELGSMPNAPSATSSSCGSWSRPGTVLTLVMWFWEYRIAALTPEPAV